MRAALKILRAIVIALLCVILIVNVWLLAARFILKQDLPKVFGFSQAAALSGSMEPTFSAGDMVIFRERDSYKVGDVVIFRQGGSFVTHRIIGETEGGFTTKGDANNAPDSGVLDPLDIEGELVTVIPRVGGALTFLRSPLGLLIIVIVGIALIELPRLFENKRKRGKKRERTN